MATEQVLSFNDPHEPKQNAIDVFASVLPVIKQEIIKSRREWDKHEPRMWSRASNVSDTQLTTLDLSSDLVSVRSAVTSNGTIILGKIRIPAINDDFGQGFIHVRIHDPPNRGAEDVTFHSLFTDEGTPAARIWRAIQTNETPLVFFNE